MAAVDIGLRHDDDLVVPELFEIKLVSDACAEGCDDGLELIVAVDLVGARLFDVQHLAPEGKDCLEAGVPTLRGRAAGGVALDDVNFGECGVCVVAVAQLVGHLPGLKSCLAADCLFCLARRLSGAVCHHCLIENRARHRRVFLQELRELLGDDVADKRADRGVAELCLGLSFKLRVGQLDGDNRGQAFAHILAGNLVVLLDDALFLAVGVEH